MQDLAGILVVSIEQAVAAPYASCRLADAGARVIKVERPGGDFARLYDRSVLGQSSYFVWLNRGKESLVLDLKDPADLGLLRSMLAQADVLIQNLAPGALERMGLGPQQLSERFPGLILCSITGYGSDGPGGARKAYDLLVQAESGLCSINGTGEGGPARVGISVCDIAAGMQACQAILQALYGRTRTGRGARIEVSLYHALADWMNVPYLQTRYGEAPPPRLGLAHPSIAPYGAFPCADGKLVLLSIQNEREWQRLCAIVLEDPDLAHRPGFAGNVERVANRTRVDGTIAACLARFSSAETIERLEQADIAYGRVSEMADLCVHPDNRYLEVATQAGPVSLLAPGAQVNGAPAGAGPVPALDEHGAGIRAEFAGMDPLP